MDEVASRNTEETYRPSEATCQQPSIMHGDVNHLAAIMLEKYVACMRERSVDVGVGVMCETESAVDGHEIRSWLV